MQETDRLDQYILEHIDEESEYLKALYRDTHVKLLRPRMASGHLQGRLLKMLVRMIRPRRILEIGTYSGYSALCMAESLEPDGRLYTFEINDEQEDFTRPWIENSPYASQIEFIIGDALKRVPEMGLTFDMAFVDGDKRRYTDYYEMILPRLEPGGYILADNTLWDGHVLEPPPHKDAQTRGIMDFNNRIAADSRVENVILPLRDGLTLIRKKSNKEYGQNLPADTKGTQRDFHATNQGDERSIGFGKCLPHQSGPQHLPRVPEHISEPAKRRNRKKYKWQHESHPLRTGDTGTPSVTHHPRIEILRR